jgi:hypothetical protein
MLHTTLNDIGSQICIIIQLLPDHILKVYYFPIEWSMSWGLHLDLIVLQVYMPVTCFDYCNFIVSFEVGKCELFFFLNIILVSWGPLKFQVYLTISFLIYATNLAILDKFL